MKNSASQKSFKRKIPTLKVKGFTLIELLVSLVLGLVVLGGVLSIFSGTQQSFRVNENLARVQENARLSFELISREIREAGSTPCGTRAMANVIRDAGAIPWYADWQAGTVVGFDGAQSSNAIAAFGVANLNRVSDTDAIIVLRNISDESSIRTVTKHDVPNFSFLVQPKPSNSYSEADLISICDASSGALLQVGTVTAATSSLSEIEYKNGTLNCSVNLGFPTGLCVLPPVKTFGNGALVTRYDPVFWYVGFNSDGNKSLYRANVVTRRIAGTETATVVRQEMIPFIQDMQIEYLVRDSAAGNTLATSWIAASNDIFSVLNGAWGATNLKQVVATRLTLTLTSEDKVSATGQVLKREFISVSGLRSRDIP